MPTTKIEVVFDGANTASRLPQQDNVDFFDRFMGYYSVYESTPGNALKANVTFAGSDWRVATMRFGSIEPNMTIIRDADSSGGRRVELIQLGFNSDVELSSTRALHITGWDGESHSVKLGDYQDGSTYSISLFAENNTVETGNAWVNNIQTGSGTSLGKDAVSIGPGGAGSISTGSGNDNVSTRDGYVRSIYTGDGNDTVNLGSGGASLVRTSSGNDKILLRDMEAFSVVSVQAGQGTDTVDFKKFKSGVTFSLNLDGQFQNAAAPDADRSVPASGYISEISIENINGSRQADVITGDNGANKLSGRGGDDRISGLRGNDSLIGGKGKDTFVFSAEAGVDRVKGFTKGQDLMEISDHFGGFDSLSIATEGKNLEINHNGGTIVLLGRGGTGLSADDFDFV